MSYQRRSMSPFRFYTNTDGSGDTYNLTSQLDEIEMGDLSALYNGYWVGFKLRAYCAQRGIFGHASQSWTQDSLLSCITNYEGSSVYATDRSLMSTLHGITSGSFNFGDDSLYWRPSSVTGYQGPLTYSSYTGGTAPGSNNNTQSNFALLTFTEAT